MSRNAALCRERPAGARLVVSLADSPAARREAQRLRFQVFAEEMEASLPTLEYGIDADEYDAHCEHLVARDEATGEVVGTYRVLPGERAAALGGFYSEKEFDLGGIRRLPKLVEIGRACIHPAYRNGGVIALLLGGLTRHIVARGYEHVIGCASFPLADDVATAARVRARLWRDHASPPELRAVPYTPLLLPDVPYDADTYLPPLIKGYMRLGAWVCGEPAWDPAFQTADFLVMLAVARLDRRYARRFLRAA
jgi:putative hemolysin